MHIIGHSKLIAAVCMEILCAAELDIFVSGLPQIQCLFNLSTVEVELMLVTNLIAGAIAAFIVGNFSDKYGSKKIILGGLYIFVLGTMLCIFAESYIVVLLGRIIEGIGIAGPGVLSYVIIVEEYDKSDQPRLMAFMSGCITVSMAFVPIIGSYVNSIYGWRYNFTILLLFSIILIVIVNLVLSTSKENKDDIKISLKAYVPIFTSKAALCCIIAICFLSGVYWVFIGMAPIFYVEVLGISVKEFGYHQSFVAFLFGILCLCNSFFLNRYGVKRCFYISMIFAVICTILVSLLGILDARNAIIITLICGCTVASLMFPINIIYPLSLDILPNTKGRMASLIRSFRLLLSGCMIHVTSYYYTGSFGIISLMLVFILTCGLYFVWRSWKFVQV